MLTFVLFFGLLKLMAGFKSLVPFFAVVLLWCLLCVGAMVVPAICEEVNLLCSKRGIRCSWSGMIFVSLV